MDTSSPNETITAGGVAPPRAATAAPPRLQVLHLSKTFGRSRALADVSMSVAPGEIHALVGENGSGKSTLVKVLSGVHAPDPSAEVRIDGQPLTLPARPAQLRAHGLAVVHQDLGLIDAFTVVENMRAGRLRGGRLTRAIRWQAERERARAGLSSLGASEIDPDALLGNLTMAQRAEVAIARALQDHAPGRGLILFDESTRALPPQPRRHFHTLTRAIAQRGGAIVLISHQIEEVLAHADRVTVLRDGHVVAAGTPTAGLSEHELIRLMLGRELARRAARRQPATAHPDRDRNDAAGRTDTETVAQTETETNAAAASGNGTDSGTGTETGNNAEAAAAPEAGTAAEAHTTNTPTGARVHGLRGAVLAGVGFAVRPGEVLGITGLLGSGFEEIPYLLAGARRAQAGTLTLAGVEHDLSRTSVQALLNAGVALVPERRDQEGLALQRSVLENVTLPRVRRRGRRAATGRTWQQEEARWAIETLGVRPADPQMPAGALSGGNQQKVLLAKWLCGRPQLLALHEPTQGVDVGAREDIERAVIDVARSGTCVILAGMDVGELVGLCDRVLVIADGRLAAELTADELTPERIVAAVYGGESERVRVAA